MYIFQRTLLCIRIHNYTLTSACDFQSKFIFYHLTCVYSDCTIRSLRYCTSLLLFTPEESHGACLLFLNLDIRDDNPLASVVSLFGYQLTCYWIAVRISWMLLQFSMWLKVNVFVNAAMQLSSFHADSRLSGTSLWKGMLLDILMSSS